MTKIQATKLTQEIAKEYLGKEWKKSLTDIQAEIWTDELIKFDHGLAKKTIRTMFTMHPACENPFNWKMPYLCIFDDYYKDIKKPRRDYCPCCKGDNKVLVKAGSCEYMTICDCVEEKEAIEIIKESYWTKVEILAQEYFRKNLEIKCILLQCEPKENYPCPLGSQWYNAKKIEFMDREKQKPEWKLGRTFHKKGGFVEGVLNSLNDIGE